MTEHTAESANGDQITTGKTAAAPPKRGSRLRLFIALGVVVALGVPAFFAATSFGLIGGARGNAKKFFEALSESDAATALSYVDQSNIKNSDLLTDEVLRKSNELGKITDIRVSRLGGDARKSVTVDFKMGGEQQSGWYEVNNVDGEWKLAEGVFKAPVSAPNRGKDGELPPLKVNGVEVNVDEFYIFPGTYEFTSGNANFSWEQEGGKSVLLGGILQALTVINASVSEAGEAEIRTAIADYFTACGAQKVLEPAGCPFRVADRREIDLSTLVYTVKPQLNTIPGSPFATTKVNRAVEFSVATSYSYVDGTPGGSQVDGDIFANTAHVTIDLAQQPPVVTLR